MSKRIWKTLLIPCLIIIMLMPSIQPAYASYATWYLDQEKDEFYSANRKTSGSFYCKYDKRTYNYEIASSVYYWHWDYDTDHSAVGTIRVSGGAKVITTGRVGVLSVTVSLILNPSSGGITQQDGEIAIREKDIGTINCEVNKPGDSKLLGLTQFVLGLVYEIMTLPFDPADIVYLLYSGSDLDKDAGPAGSDSTAHVTGRAKRGSAPNDAGVAFEFLYSYYKDGASGWKSYDLSISVRVEFGYWQATRTGQYRIVAARKYFSQSWRVYVKW